MMMTMIELDIQISEALGETSVDAAAAGWLLVDYIASLSDRIETTAEDGRIQFHGKRPFCELRPISDSLICHVYNNGHSQTTKLHSMADWNLALQTNISDAYLMAQNGRS